MASTTITLSTLPPPAGFTAIADQPDFVPKIKRRNDRVSERAAPRDGVQCKFGPKGVTFSPAQYPQAVDCLRVGLKLTTTTKTFQIGGKTTTLPRATSTVTLAVTTTESTFLNPPDVTAIVQESTTITITSTTESTTTMTVTSTSKFHEQDYQPQFFPFKY